MLKAELKAASGELRALSSETQGATTSGTNQAQTLLANKSNSLTSEAVVKQRLTAQLGENQAILEKPRIYIGDGSSGKYAQPDFGVYNTKTGQFVKLVGAKDGNGTLTRAQQQINQYGGILRI